MKRFNLGIVIGLTAVVAAGAYFGWSKLKPRDPVPAEGLRLAPDFALKRANGEEVKLSSLRDHMVIVHFWASWCPPCIPELPEILSAAKKLPKDNNGRAIYWVFVSQDETWEKAHSILKDEALPENAISVLDPEARVSDLFGTYQFPETYLITRDRGIGAKWIGPQGWSGEWGRIALEGIESASRYGILPKLASPH